jgi:hypothetical protein
VTIGRQQAAAQDARVARACAKLTAAALKQCARATSVGVGDQVIIDCGNSLSTNGSCSFADTLLRAFHRGYDYYGGGSEGGATRVTLRFAGTPPPVTNPLDCVPQGATGVTWRQHGTWRCQSLISQVWVKIAATAR